MSRTLFIDATTCHLMYVLSVTLGFFYQLWMNFPQEYFTTSQMAVLFLTSFIVEYTKTNRRRYEDEQSKDRRRTAKPYRTRRNEINGPTRPPYQHFWWCRGRTALLGLCKTFFFFILWFAYHLWNKNGGYTKVLGLNFEFKSPPYRKALKVCSDAWLF